MPELVGDRIVQDQHPSYNLEGSKANIVRLSNLILLIAIAYISACLKGKSFKNQGHQKYITRLTETQRKYRRLA
ncbi:MAG: hypothetical protein QNJ72_12690 [Pleurocapsa sp. MO_226.B13]|nr:hypothetical protein [Pleurocapsa sp. MO_226.B13]